MTGFRNPKDPLAIPKAIRLREKAGALKHKAEALLMEADALIFEAEGIESARPRTLEPREDVEEHQEGQMKTKLHR
jgi:hypothetical protein